MCPIVFGNWTNGDGAGPGARNVNNHRSNSNANVGLRCDPDSTSRPSWAEWIRGRCFPALGCAKSVWRALSSSLRVDRQGAFL